MFWVWKPPEVIPDFQGLLLIGERVRLLSGTGFDRRSLRPHRDQRFDTRPHNNSLAVRLLPNVMPVFALANL